MVGWERVNSSEVEMSEERKVVPQLLALFQRPDGRLDASYYHADVKLPEVIGAPNAVNSVKDLDTLLDDLHDYMSHPETKRYPEDVGRLLIRIQNGREWLKYIGPGGDFMRGLAHTIEGIVSFNLEPGANPPTAEELERWRVEQLDDAGLLGPPEGEELREGYIPPDEDEEV